MNKVVVFDTGTGGRIFAEHFRREFPEAEIIEVIDTARAPYGERSDEEIAEMTRAALADYLGTNALIVLACNTATAYAIDRLRADFPEQVFVGVEPGVKPAVELTKSGRILMLATPASLRSERYRSLLARFAGKVRVLEADCTDWAHKIDGGELTDAEVVRVLKEFDGVDVVVLGCTHYLAIPRVVFAEALPETVVYSPLEAVTQRVREILRQR